MSLIGADSMQTAVMRRNGEVYELLGELLGECSACDLHLAMSLLAKLKLFGLNAPLSSLVLQPEAVLQNRRLRTRKDQLAFHSLGETWDNSARTSSIETKQDAYGPWASLPTDLILSIADKLGDEERMIMACTCSSWKEAIGGNTNTISFLWTGRRTCDTVTGQPLVVEVCNEASRIFTDIQNVTFRRCELLSSKALAQFVHNCCPSLKVIDLSGCIQLTDEGLDSITGNCRLLQKIQLSSCTLLTDHTFKRLGQTCHLLEEINLCGCDKLTDEALVCLSQGNRNLKRINIGWCEQITSEGILSLATNCPGLQAVDLCGCLQVGDEGIAGLAEKCPELESLCLHCVRRLTDAAPLALATNLRNLSSLNISGCRLLSSAAVQVLVDQNKRLHTCRRFDRNLIVGGCLELLSVSCACTPVENYSWAQTLPAPLIQF